MAAINTMIYMRGNSRDYDVWESEFGAKDWRWDKEKPFFKLIFSVKGSLQVLCGQIGSA
jgi:choline dehydrogenase-like flavoprotein